MEDDGCGVRKALLLKHRQDRSHVLVHVADTRVVSTALVLLHPLRHRLRRRVLECCSVGERHGELVAPRDQRRALAECVVRGGVDHGVIVEVPHPLGRLPRGVRFSETAHDVEGPPGDTALVRSVVQVFDRLVAEVPIVDLLVFLDAVAAALVPVWALAHAVREIWLVLQRPIGLGIPCTRILVERLTEPERDVAMVAKPSNKEED